MQGVYAKYIFKGWVFRLGKGHHKPVDIVHTQGVLNTASQSTQFYSLLALGESFSLPANMTYSIHGLESPSEALALQSTVPQTYDKNGQHISNCV